MLDGRGILVFLEDQFFESLRSCSIVVPLKIPTPTPAPDHPLYGISKKWQNNVLGSACPFTSNLKNRKGQKPRRDSTIHEDCFHFPEYRKAVIFMILASWKLPGIPKSPSCGVADARRAFFCPSRKKSTIGPFLKCFRVGPKQI